MEGNRKDKPGIERQARQKSNRRGKQRESDSVFPVVPEGQVGRLIALTL